MLSDIVTIQTSSETLIAPVAVNETGCNVFVSKFHDAIRASYVLYIVKPLLSFSLDSSAAPVIVGNRKHVFFQSSFLQNNLTQE